MIFSLYCYIKCYCILLGLLKDFGWMTTAVFLGFPFGGISVLLHLYLLLFDKRVSFVYYNWSLLLWVTGNFMWMSVEMFSTNPSSHIHIGPISTPMGGMSNEVHSAIITAKVHSLCLPFCCHFFHFYSFNNSILDRSLLLGSDSSVKHVPLLAVQLHRYAPRRRCHVFFALSLSHIFIFVLCTLIYYNRGEHPLSRRDRATNRTICDRFRQ
jgi:hypothetical protein